MGKTVPMMVAMNYSTPDGTVLLWFIHPYCLGTALYEMGCRSWVVE